MKIKTFLYIAILGVVALSSCSKWLDVKPEDKFIEEDLFSRPQGFADAINGLYIQNGTNSMYGRNLTMTSMEVLAQFYLVSNSNNSYYPLSNFAYTENSALSFIDGIWTNMYTNILNVNNLLMNLEKQNNVLTPVLKDRYTGEALGLRAFYYFELMRMFTKPYTSIDSLSAIIPYYDKPAIQIEEYKPTNYIMQRILDDLGRAENLLSTSDPAVTAGRLSKTTLSFGRDSRNYAMNYYAVKALQARVNLWKGDKGTALKAAEFLIQNQAKFPFITVADLGTTKNNTFATEMIFGVENQGLVSVFNDNFNPNLFDSEILAPNTTGAFITNTVYEGFENDYRYQTWWKVNGRSYPTFFKYQEVVTSSYNFNRTVPLIRLGEMYLIAAECEENPIDGLAYLNELRSKRNVPAASISTTLDQEIMKEYRKEFNGEGQLFFYYKRKGVTSVISGATNIAKTVVPENFVFPIPYSETDPR